MSSMKFLYLAGTMSVPMHLTGSVCAACAVNEMPITAYTVDMMTAASIRVFRFHPIAFKFLMFPMFLTNACTISSDVPYAV